MRHTKDNRHPVAEAVVAVAAAAVANLDPVAAAVVADTAAAPADDVSLDSPLECPTTNQVQSEEARPDLNIPLQNEADLRPVQTESDSSKVWVQRYSNLMDHFLR